MSLLLIIVLILLLSLARPRWLSLRRSIHGRRDRIGPSDNLNPRSCEGHLMKHYLSVLGAFLLAALIFGAPLNSQVIPQPGPPTPIGCAYNTTPPTLTDGQAGWVQCSPRGSVITIPSTTSAGLTPIVGGSAASSQVLKASAGTLYSSYAHCTSACWMMVFNSTAAPSNGATTAGTSSGNLVECVAVPANTTAGLNYAPGPPAAYSTGITVAISSTSCGTLTLSTVGFIHGMIGS
jgi:hypothetical protein